VSPVAATRRPHGRAEPMPTFLKVFATAHGPGSHAAGVRAHVTALRRAVVYVTVARVNWLQYASGVRLTLLIDGHWRAPRIRRVTLR